MNKLTKIVATIGPATDSEEVIEQLILSGMNIARFNTKHSTIEWHQERIKRVRKVADRMKVPLGILLDLQGPEIRITIPGGEPISLKEGQEVTFVSEEHDRDPKKPFIPQKAIDTLDEGNTIMMDDGIGEFVITGKEGNILTARALHPFIINNRKTLNTPGVVVDMPSLIPQDIKHLDAVKDNLIDYVGLSYVRNVDDIEVLRAEMAERKLGAGIISKIENQAALDNIEDIIEMSDAIMVARGDLAVEVPYEELAYWQKHIIHKSREAGKPVITATQMLTSMVERSRPTRAEVSDVANAVYDGTDAVMLSEETTIGKHPVKAVATQAKIAAYNEQHSMPKPLATQDSDESSYITHSAISLLEIAQLESNAIDVDKIVCLTETGRTARLISRFRPHIPVCALTSNERTYRQLSMVFNVTPHIAQLPAGEKLESSEKLLELVEKLDIGHTGETILLIHGTFWKKPGLTNTLSILKMP